MKSPDEAYAGLDAESRLTRLVNSGRCEATDSKKYRAELRQLVSTSSKGRNLRSQSEVFKALSAEIRLKMMYTLLRMELCECEIMVALNLTQSTASHHLSILERAGLVARAKRGKWVFYRATEEGRSQIVGGRRIGSAIFGSSDFASIANPSPNNAGRQTNGNTAKHQVFSEHH